MPAARITRRRRSSLGTSKANAFTYNYARPASQAVTFAPNLTPITFTTECDQEDSNDDLSYPFSNPPAYSSPSMFPPSSTPAPPPTRRRAPAGKRPSQGYIPRPPNAFMLFRADFVRQKHVPGSIETNHGSLSKIIGETWQRLAPADKRVWEKMASQAKAEHKLRHPNYRFKPVHNKNKKDTKLKKETTSSRKKAAEAETEEARCGAVAGLLISGYRGEVLAAAVRDMDAQFQAATSSGTSSPAPPAYDDVCLPPRPQWRGMRRSSSVPPAMTSLGADNGYNNGQFFHPSAFLNNIALPSVPFHGSYSRPVSPLPSRGSNANYGYALRRSSSARPADDYAGHWDNSMYSSNDLVQQPIYNDTYAQAPDTSLFDPNFTINTNPAYNFSEILTSLPPNGTPPRLDISSYNNIDSIAPHQLSLSPVSGYPSNASFSASTPSLGSHSHTGSPYHMTDYPNVSFNYSQSNAPSPTSMHEVDIVAPQPMSAGAIGTSFADVLDEGVGLASADTCHFPSQHNDGKVKSLLAELADDEDSYMHFSDDMNMNMEEPVLMSV